MDTEQRIAKINELSLHLRSIWIGLLLALVFVGITLMGHRDADFFAFGAATTLPVVSVDVNPAAFFLAAPVLITAIYVYLHIFLMPLWDHIGEAAPDDGTGTLPLSDRVAPTIFALAAIWYRGRTRADGSMAPSVLGASIVGIALALGWAFGLFVLLVVWIRGMPLHDFTMTLVAAVCLWAASVVGLLSLRAAEGRMRGLPREHMARVRPGLVVSLAAVLPVMVLASWERTRGGLLAAAGVPPALQIPLARADLREAELTKRPADWQPFDLFLLAAGVTGDTSPERIADVRRLWQNRLDTLEAPDLTGRDLRGADLTNAFLPGANLKGADLTGAQMQDATLSGVNFRGSTFDGVSLRHAELQGAVLSGLKIDRSDFSFALMAFSDLYASRILESSFSHVDLSGADLGETLFLGSSLVRVQLYRAKLENAAFVRSEMPYTSFIDANLSGVFAGETQFGQSDFSGSNLSYSTFLDSDLTYSRFQGNTVLETCFVVSNLAGASFENVQPGGDPEYSVPFSFAGSSLTDAELSGLAGVLKGGMVTQAWGHADTALPDGMDAPAHWSDAPLGGLGGGGKLTPVPPWFERTRQRSAAAQAEDDASNLSVIIDDGWKGWVEQARPVTADGYPCGVDWDGRESLRGGVLDLWYIDYTTLEEEVYRIMSREWMEGDLEQWGDLPDLPPPVMEDDLAPDPAEDVAAE
ncbi:pentapeptide repeat-containing protein [Roseobacter sp. S98]|uniref:pentapeptide repeat-containing protein n=1 Tax=Roseobacter algicola (ex Choi et al. 2025) (nom. illeg.) TaxID=3092138 RepID=UPI0035C6C0FC